MADKSKEPKEQDNYLSLLNIAIDALSRAKEAEIATPAQTAFTLASVLLTMIRVGFLLARLCRLVVNVYRTRWSLKWTTSNWGSPVLVSAKPLTEG